MATLELDFPKNTYAVQHILPLYPAARRAARAEGAERRDLTIFKFVRLHLYGWQNSIQLYEEYCFLS